MMKNTKVVTTSKSIDPYTGLPPTSGLSFNFKFVEYFCYVCDRQTKDGHICKDCKHLVEPDE